MKRQAYLLLFYLLLGLGTALRSSAQSPPPPLDDIVSINSMELMGKIFLAQQYEVLARALDSLSLQDSLLVEAIDSLRIAANVLAAEHNYTVRKVDRGENELIERQFELRKDDKLLQRHAGWLDRYYRRVNFVRYRYHYPKKRDKWAKWVWIGSNMLFIGRISHDFTRK